MKAGDPIRNKAILMDKIANEVSGLIGLIADTVQARTFDEFLKIGLADGPGA